MLRRILVSASLAFALSILTSADATATAQRTFVASYGNDANLCSITQPCRGFTRALTQTSAGGEVIVLDSAGYGVVTVAQSVSIVAPAGIYAGITVSSGNGVTVNAPGATVVLRGLSINGQGGAKGISFVQGLMLTVEGCEISGMTMAGIEANAPDSQTTVTHSVVRNNDDGIVGRGFGGVVRVIVANSTISDNQTGAITSANSGFVQFHLSRSVVTGNGVGLWVTSGGSGNGSFLVEDSTITFAKNAAFDLHDDPKELIYTTGNNAVGYVQAIIQGGGTLTPCCAM